MSKETHHFLLEVEQYGTGTGLERNLQLPIVHRVRIAFKNNHIITTTYWISISAHLYKFVIKKGKVS